MTVSEITVDRLRNMLVLTGGPERKKQMSYVQTQPYSVPEETRSP